MSSLCSPSAFKFDKMQKNSDIILLLFRSINQKYNESMCVSTIRTARGSSAKGGPKPLPKDNEVLIKYMQQLLTVPIVVSERRSISPSE
jgi:hypothetical protein